MAKKRKKKVSSGRTEELQAVLAVKEKDGRSEEELITELERELRRYVKKDGGFRKGLTRRNIERAEQIMEALDREKPEWDLNIHIEGMDNPSVSGLTW